MFYAKYFKIGIHSRYKMEDLVKNNYKTIVLSNEVAGFSEDIIKKYQNNKDINIIISPRRQV